jgi:hypothetical protein
VVTLVEGLADISGALGALQKASDIVKKWTSSSTDKERATEIIELNREIETAQRRAITANAAQTSLIQEVETLKAEIARFETWDTEKTRYELKPTGHKNILVYSLKEDAQPPEYPHSICPNCYQERKKRILQQITRFPGRSEVQVCQDCGWEAYLAGGWYPEHKSSRAR